MAWSVGEKRGETKRARSSEFAEFKPSGESLPAEAVSNEASNTGAGKNRDLAGGMEMLEQDFLLGVVENTEGNNNNDVTMRKLVFNELLRREKLDTIDSNALKVYAINRDNLYGKDIQCEAMKKLTERTLRKTPGG